jgi:glycosyltransferase involved in cell wall biosynthesis
MIPDSTYTPNEVENHPNVGIIRTKEIPDQFLVDGIVTDEFFNLFNRIAGEYHIDVICSSRNSCISMYKRLLEAPRFHDNDGDFTDKTYGMPVVLLEEFPQTRKRQASSRAYWLNQMLGYVSADKSVFLSDHNRGEVLQEMKDYFVPSEVKRFVDNSRIIPAGIECAELDKICDDKRWTIENGFNAIYVGRIFGVSYAEFLPWADYLFKSGISDVTFTISLSGNLSGPMRKKLKGIGFDFNSVGRQFNIIENNPRKNFLPMLRKFHAFIVPVSHLDHPTGIFEALYLGVPGILPISDYQQTFFKDYPFVINPKKKEELVSMLLWIRDHKEEAREMVKPWRDIIREKYDAKDNIAKLANEIEEVAHSYIDRFKTSNGVVKLVQGLKGKQYEFTEVLAYLKKAGIQGVCIGNTGKRLTFTYSRGAIHHAMRLAGFVDTCESANEIFVRRDVFESNFNNKVVKNGTEKNSKKTKGLRKRASTTGE